MHFNLEIIFSISEGGAGCAGFVKTTILWWLKPGLTGIREMTRDV